MRCVSKISSRENHGQTAIETMVSPRNDKEIALTNKKRKRNLLSEVPSKGFILLIKRKAGYFKSPKRAFCTASKIPSEV